MKVIVAGFLELFDLEIEGYCFDMASSITSFSMVLDLQNQLLSEITSDFAHLPGK